MMSSDKSVIRNCSLGYACTCKWDELKKLKSENIRFCNTCQKEVHDCNSIADLAESILLNRSVHIGEDVFDEVESGSVVHIERLRTPGFAPLPSGYRPQKQPQQSYTPDLDDGWDDDIPF